MTDREIADRLARSLLYEGYALYPYRRSALKNQKRWMFGTLYPRAWAEARGGPDRWQVQMECLLQGEEQTTVSVLFRFLVESAETAEQEVAAVADLRRIIGSELREAFSTNAVLNGELTISAAEVSSGVFKLTVRVRNLSPLEEPGAGPPLARSLAAMHLILETSRGSFLSVTDPPLELREAAAQCVNSGVWPVLIGNPGTQSTILASPIILADYPELAPESRGDQYDATEIEELLTLRVLTLTDGEKAEIRASDERARELLDRAESLPAEHLLKLHGRIRGLTPAQTPSPSTADCPATGDPWSAWDSLNKPGPPIVRIGGADLKPGDRVRLHPRRRADILDAVLEGQTGIIEAIEQDFEDNVHIAVVLDDDPGRDLGQMRQAGHRFFFAPEEIEATPAIADASSRKSSGVLP
jgi:hypothetical protein